MSQLHILIAEDHGIVRLGTRLLIKEMYPLAQVAEATNFKSTLQQLEKKQFDLLILDINIPGGDSIQMIQAVRNMQQDIPILILSSYDESIYAIRYLKAGANGYLQKESDPQEIKTAIHKVLHNQPYASDTVQQQLFQSLSATRNPQGAFKLKNLSDREIEIMHLLAKGVSPTEIKNKLHIQLSTISTHKARIFEKMEVSNVVELAEKLREIELIRRNAADNSVNDTGSSAQP